jgi:hypothetical protein
MNELLNLKSEYRDEDLYKDKLIDKSSETGDFSLTDAEQKTSEVIDRLNSLGFPASTPDHRVKPRDERDGLGAEYEKGVGENGTITFYSGDENSVGSMTKGGEPINYHELGHHIGYEIKSRIHNAIDDDASDVESNNEMIDYVRINSYLRSEDFADRFRVAVTGNNHRDLRSSEPGNHSGLAGDKYSKGKDNWEQSLPELVDNLEDEVDEMVEDLSAEGWEIERPVL